MVLSRIRFAVLALKITEKPAVVVHSQIQPNGPNWCNCDDTLYMYKTA